MLGANSADNNLMILFLFSSKNKKNISKCPLLNFVPYVQSVNFQHSQAKPVDK